MPALLTRMSTLPNSAIAASTSAWQSSGRATSVGTAIARRPAASTSLLRVGQPVLAPGAEDDVGPGLGERPGEDGAQARGGAGDDRHPPVEPEHVKDRAVCHRVCSCRRPRALPALPEDRNHSVGLLTSRAGTALTRTSMEREPAGERRELRSTPRARRRASRPARRCGGRPSTPPSAPSRPARGDVRAHARFHVGVALIRRAEVAGARLGAGPDGARLAPGQPPRGQRRQPAARPDRRPGPRGPPAGAATGGRAPPVPHRPGPDRPDDDGAAAMPQVPSPQTVLDRVRRDVERNALRARNGIKLIAGVDRPGRRADPQGRRLAARPHAAVALPQRERPLRAAAADRVQPGQPQLHPRPHPGQQLRRATARRRVRRVPARLGRAGRARRGQPARGLRRRLHPRRHRPGARALRRRRGQPLRLLLRRRPHAALRRAPPGRAAAQPHRAGHPGRLPAHGPARRHLLGRPDGRRLGARPRRQRPAVDRRPGLPRAHPHRRGDPVREPLGAAVERRVRRLLPGHDRLVRRPRALPGRGRARDGRRCSCTTTG